jgi:hypothetical protein
MTTYSMQFDYHFIVAIETAKLISNRTYRCGMSKIGYELETIEYRADVLITRKFRRHL